MITRALIAGVLLLGLSQAQARWKAEYVNSSPEEQAWYERQETTPEWRERVKASWYQKCCDHADTVRAQFDKRDGLWVYREIGQTEWKKIPQDIVQPDVSTPHGEAVLFVDATGNHYGPVCFFPGGTGT